MSLPTNSTHFMVSVSRSEWQQQNVDSLDKYPTWAGDARVLLHLDGVFQQCPSYPADWWCLWLNYLLPGFSATWVSVTYGGCWSSNGGFLFLFGTLPCFASCISMLSFWDTEHTHEGLYISLSLSWNAPCYVWYYTLFWSLLWLKLM